HRLGELLGGPEGRDMQAAAIQAIGEQGIANPSRWLSMYLPGAWRAPTSERGDLPRSPPGRVREVT
ncbi:MAG TPA: hypothetical protein VKU41_28715, partial [Polyangiaceae bacterium]|nr:hypothetical protein [Polyangiaceae bacterium]